jgi:hypothetical protein
MNVNKSILAAVLGLSAVSVAQAGTVYLTGSTAARGAVFAALTTPGRVFSSINTNYTRQGTAASACNYMYIAGPVQGSSVQTAISCHWSGSEAGVSDVANGTSTPEFIDPSTIPNGTANTSSADPSATIQHKVDIAMADNVQDFAGVYANNVNPPALLNNGTALGVITFKWVRNNGLWTGGNVTSSQIRQALGGFCRQAVFTGVATDTTNNVYVSGRDNGSGTRVNAFGESGFGIFNLPNQIEVNAAGVMQDLDGGGTFAGDFGFSSGGLLAATMGANTTTSTDQWDPPKTGFSIIAYLSNGDAGTAIGNGAHELTYNGIAFSAANIKEGTYTFWGNEYVYQANSFGDAQTPNVFTRLSTTIPLGFSEPSTITFGAMHCSKVNPISDPVHP